MKLIVLLMTVAILQISAATRAQNITMKKDKASLEQVIKEIRQQSGYDFFYNLKLIQKATPVSINIKNMPLEEALKKVFENQPLTYTVTIADKAVVVKEKQGTSVPEKVNNLLFIPVTVTGKVTDTTGTPLANATLKIKGQSNSILTDDKGTFTFSAESGAEVTVSFIGFRNYTFKVVEGIPFQNIVLHTLAKHLDEVVVVNTGYQTLPKERATGAFTVVDNKLLNRSFSPDIVSRLVNVTNGLQKDNSTNASGNALGISIRGRSTLFSNSTPLIVLDNFPYEGDVNNINPNDIESATVLKDAAAASIWGVKSGNGVIVLTSKKGKIGQPLSVSLTANFTTSAKPDLSKSPTISSSEFIGLEKYLFEQGAYDFPLSDTYGFPQISPAIKILADQRNGKISQSEANSKLGQLSLIDVKDDISKYWLRNLANQQYALNVSGGGSKNKYYISGGYDRDLSTDIGSDYSRISLKASNVFSSPNDKLTISTDLQFVNSKRNNNNVKPDNIYAYSDLVDGKGNALSIDKYNSNYIDTAGNGKLLDWTYRPYNDLKNSDNKSSNIDYLINLGVNYKLTQWLNADVTYQYGHGLNNSSNLLNQDTYYTRNLINSYSAIDQSSGIVFRPIPLGGILDRNSVDYTSQYARTSLNFGYLAGKNSISGIVGAELRDIAGNASSFRLYGYDDSYTTNLPIDYTTLFPSIINGSALQIPYADGIYRTSERNVSLFGNMAYTYNNKYTISASARKDGSNYFGLNSNQKWNPLWSTGILWDISKESFFNLKSLSELRFRATYGYNGNINKSASALLTTLVLGANTYGQVPSVITNPPNPNLRWEKVAQFNIGFDLAAFDSRVQASFDYYSKKGLDLFGTSILAPSSGNPLFFGNTSEMKGHGLDISLKSTNLNGKLSWQTMVNFNYSRDEVTKYNFPINNNQSYVNGSILVVGRPVVSLYSYKWEGLDPQNGDPQGLLNGKVSKNYGDILSSLDPGSIVYNGPMQAPYFGNFLNTFNYQNISLSVNISYKFGNFFRRNSIDYGQVFNGTSLPNVDYLNRWQKSGDENNTNVPSMLYPADAQRNAFYQGSEILVQKGDVIRLNDIQINYELPRRFLNGLGIKELTVYGIATNLGMIWKANKYGIDPDYNIQPSYLGSIPSKSYSVGLKATF